MTSDLGEKAKQWAQANVNATGYDPMMLVVWRIHRDAYLAGATAALEWQPIESAPKGKNVIVVSRRFPDPHEARLYEDGWHTWGVNGAFRDDPFKWMPLPAPPSTSP
jgi:hypothetical protein